MNDDFPEYFQKVFLVDIARTAQTRVELPKQSPAA